MSIICVRKYHFGLAATVCAGLVGLCLAQSSPPKATVIQSFKAQIPEPTDKDPNIKYDLDPTAEKFAVFVPKEFKDQPGWGVIVFIGGDGVWDTLPPGWEAVLKQRKLLAVIPQNASNDQPTDRRMGMAVLGVREMMQEHKLDPNRVYATGISGGARVANLLGFCQPSLFKGTIQSCGADWIDKVPQEAKISPDDEALGDYGVFHATDTEVAAAKAGVKFVFITGSKDFRHAAIVDIYHGGYQKAGFNAKLIDVPGMPHQPCSAKQLNAALDFIEGIAPTTVPVAAVKPDAAGPLWGTSDPKKWPQILAYNDGVLNNNNGIGGSAFLLKLPDGNVVAATAVHVFGDGVKADDIDKLVKTWAITLPGNPKKKVTVKKLAITPDPDAPLDCVLANVTSHSGFEPLIPRLSPPDVGETVYVLGLLQGTKGTQTAFAATVTSRDDDKSEFKYAFDPEIDTNGFSGAPVLDSKGRAVGIHLGHGTESNGKKFWYGVEIAAPIKQLTAKK